MTRTEYQNLMAARASALRQFNTWEANHPLDLPPEKIIESLGFLYQLLPANDRQTPVNPAGIMNMRRALAHLK